MGEGRPEPEPEQEQPKSEKEPVGLAATSANPGVESSVDGIEGKGRREI
jgi:hypothetical protein